VEREASKPAGGLPELAPLMDVNDVACVLRCSARTVYRLADSGRIPAPVKLGGLVRWPRHIVEHWIVHDCPPCGKLRAGR